MNTLSRAMESTLRSDAAEPLFDKAIERFKEVIASGYLNWAQVGDGYSWSLCLWSGQ